ncbi:LuxR C-terminal-related transcriptional regulator [Streptomyces sp. WMMC500]|uniref:LuxR C-terminal-related transcriptional regulator n=1 Tax=Streptomyces sp. WMMC500 TaxID=3015154 RepID=UPI00248B44B8|nr:LuxR C-terminal-related transcriptional regulator [Streptomyces sp. WMMC500]WBB63112.1 LuxR C-terminal-related transcriptional regulator [Streptomyces sp. WMMC500]
MNADAVVAAAERENLWGPEDLLAGGTTSPAGYIGATPTSLIGRTRDLDRLATVLSAPDAGLVTVTGPAGVGKSRLVMEYFRRFGSGPGGTVEVFDFARIPDPAMGALMLRRLTEQFQEDPGSVRASLERLGPGPVTVLFDHYEDVADELAPLLAEFRRSFPEVRIVAVGTARLGLYGERVVRLRPLPTGHGVEADLPAVSRIPAVELFVQCARAVRPEFKLTAENLRYVLALCRLVGGLPFAVELAAEQVRLAEPDLILERFERGTDDLRRAGRHPYSRHAGISDMVAWVFARLPAEERLLLNQLAVFEGPFTTRAAAGVLTGFDAAGYRTMERLIDASVVIPDERPDGELSLSIPAPVRHAAARSLALLPCHATLRKAHGEYFRALAMPRPAPPAEAGTAVAGPRPGAGPECRADLLAAFGYWREAGDGRSMAVLAGALREQSTGTGQTRQCLRLTQEALRAGVEDARLHARTLEAAGGLAMRLGSGAARGYLAQARDAYRAVHDDAGVVRCLGLLGDEAYAGGDLDGARRRFEEGLAVITTPTRAGTNGDAAASAGRHLTRRLAAVLREAGNLARADELARTALAAELGHEDLGGTVTARYVLASVRLLEQDSAETRTLFADAAEQLGGLADAPERPECLEMLAIALYKWRRITDWRLLTATLGLANRLRRRQGLARPRPLAELTTAILATASQELSADDYMWAWRSGAELTWEAAMRLMPSEDAGPAAGTDVPADVADILTKRELEVALLVSEGLTNRVIARRLGIAEWTVVNHLRKVMRKLGCQSRVQVTRRLATG